MQVADFRPKDYKVGLWPIPSETYRLRSKKLLHFLHVAFYLKYALFAIERRAKERKAGAVND